MTFLSQFVLQRHIQQDIYLGSCRALTKVSQREQCFSKLGDVIELLAPMHSDIFLTLC